MRSAWRNAVSACDPQQEIILEIGLRGLPDPPYSHFDASVQQGDEALGDTISRALRDQMSIVRERFPPEVTAVWSDTGYGKLQDAGQLPQGQGAYLHVAMMNDHADQLTKMVPIKRLLDEIQRCKTVGAPQFLLLNTSDIRPVMMSTP